MGYVVFNYTFNWCSICGLNLLALSDAAIWRDICWSSVVQIIACFSYPVKPLPKQMLNYNWPLRNKLKWNLKKIPWKNACRYVVWQIEIILLSPWMYHHCIIFDMFYSIQLFLIFFQILSLIPIAQKTGQENILQSHRSSQPFLN